jgi:hypothetical protein
MPPAGATAIEFAQWDGPRWRQLVALRLPINCCPQEQPAIFSISAVMLHHFLNDAYTFREPAVHHRSRTEMRGQMKRFACQRSKWVGIEPVDMLYVRIGRKNVGNLAPCLPDLHRKAKVGRYLSAK